MNEIIPCDIIQDLLPLYVDGLTRETTSRELEMHLARCSRCRECFEVPAAAGGLPRDQLLKNLEETE